MLLYILDDQFAGGNQFAFETSSFLLHNWRKGNHQIYYHISSPAQGRFANESMCEIKMIRVRPPNSHDSLLFLLCWVCITSALRGKWSIKSQTNKRENGKYSKKNINSFPLFYYFNILVVLKKWKNKNWPLPKTRKRRKRNILQQWNTLFISFQCINRARNMKRENWSNPRKKAHMKKRVYVSTVVS